MNSRLLHQNNALFDSDPLKKFCRFAQKKHGNDLGNFVVNKGYHCDEEVKRNLLGT